MIRLASSPEPHTMTSAVTALSQLRAIRMNDESHRDIPAPEPDPEPNPEPDAALKAQACAISQADWDTLFDAVTERLQSSTGPAALQSIPEHLLGVVSTLQETVGECVESLNSLHAMLVREREQHRRL